MSPVAEHGPLLLKALGLNSRIREAYEQALVSNEDTSNLVLGRIVRLDRGFPLVATNFGERRAQAATDLVKNAETLGVIGDWVVMRDDPDHDMGVIEHVLPRKGALVRKDPGEQTASQTIAANIDTIFILQSLSGSGVNVRRLERELVMAYESGARPVVLLTKADLVSREGDQDIAQQVERAKVAAPGVTVIALSADTGEGVDKAVECLRSGETSILLGESGVGKSTLINALLGEEKLATAAVREHDDRGRHTTVHREVIVLPGGAIIIDSPGIRSVGLWCTGEGIDAVFSEITSRGALCKFRDCTHTVEPGCKVLEGLESGEVTQERYDAYRALVGEFEQLQRKQEDKARASEKTKAGTEHKRSHRYNKKGQAGR